MSEVRLCLWCHLEPLPPCPQVPFWSGGPESCSHAAHPLPAPRLALSRGPAQDGPFPAEAPGPPLLQGSLFSWPLCSVASCLAAPPPTLVALAFSARASPSEATRCACPIAALLSEARCAPHRLATQQTSSTGGRNSCGGACAGDNRSEPRLLAGQCLPLQRLACVQVWILPAEGSCCTTGKGAAPGVG